MLLVGELINASRKSVAEALSKKDAEAVARLAREQVAAGADYLDVNAGVFPDREVELLCWLVETVQAAAPAPCCLDSPNPRALEAALAVHRGQPMINSISLEHERFEALLPLVASSGAKVVALCMSDAGMAESKEDRVKNAERLVGALVEKGVALDDVYVDPLVQPIGANDRYGLAFLQAVGAIMEKFPGVHTIAGMSNVSYGMPARKLLNHVFMIMAIAHGLDAAILNPTDQRLMAQITIATALSGQDPFCGDLIAAFRAGKLEV